ncbi:uncharacterized protein LOC114728304 [Neltuma alba]|uniref:uncharacterized protein LOC114728304 n=1 Tax=Neltuma alba TaxID=207710 RepID=UPI0010A3234A|nr:uncharacterized protein LOC114728304 [Prosopis alba]
MVVPSSNSMRSKKTNAVGIPTVDLSMERSELSELVIKACEQYGFFKAVNHGVPEEVISRLENEGIEFFSKSTSEKRQAGPATPFGYGCRNIGPSGDMGDLEYLLLHTNPLSISDRSKTISNNPTDFRLPLTATTLIILSSFSHIYIYFFISYILHKPKRKRGNKSLDKWQTRGFTWNIHICINISALGKTPSEHIIMLLKEHTRFITKSQKDINNWRIIILNRELIRDAQSHSVLRINHYPPSKSSAKRDPSMGFGEHSDPQILTILRSTEVGGLQICTRDGLIHLIDSSAFVTVNTKTGSGTCICRVNPAAPAPTISA